MSGIRHLTRIQAKAWQALRCVNIGSAMTTPNSTQAHLNAVYEGPSLADGSMNVRDLAPALMAVGSFFDEANRIANGDHASISVNVQATSPGSFEIAFEVIQNVGATNTLQAGVGDFISTAADLKVLLIGSGAATAGIIWLIKTLRGRTPHVEKINTELYKLTVDDETYEVPLRLLRLYRETSIHRNIEDMVKPLNEFGIDKFSFREKGRTVQEVTESDVPAFAVPDSREKIVDEMSRRALSIVSVVFKEDNKWRLSDGNNVFSVTISDVQFLEQIDKGAVSFSKKDILVCEMRTVQWKTNSGLLTDYEVVKIIEHRQVRQLPLVMEEDQ